MKQKSSLEQEYKNLMSQSAPDLWDRIEGNLKEYPERGHLPEHEDIRKRTSGHVRPETFRSSYSTVYKWASFGTTAIIAAACLLVIAGPWYSTLFPVRNQAGSSMETAAETTAGWIAGETVANGGTNEAASETGVDEEATADWAAGKATADWIAGETLVDEEDSRTTADCIVNEPSSDKTAGVLHYSQLNLASYSALSLPPHAVTVPEDTMYFSEDILADTELLCLGTVTSVSLEMDSSQNAALLVYDITLDSICYSQDYTESLTSLTVRSPIVASEGGENQILYQLQVGSSYVLPLKQLGSDWQLLFPFAPQIQITENGAYLFHSGYASLTDDQTLVVVGEPEGANDFYYDRMLLRDDDGFLSDVLSLVQP